MRLCFAVLAGLLCAMAPAQTPGKEPEHRISEVEAKSRISEALRHHASKAGAAMPKLDDANYTGSPVELVVLGGSEIAAILSDSAEDLKKVGVTLDFMLTGSPDIGKTVEQQALRSRYDVFIPGSGNWLESGLASGAITQKTAVAKCPVVLAATAAEISKQEWDPKNPPTMLEIAQAVQSGKLQLNQASGSQTMSGLGWATAILTSENAGKALTKEQIQGGGKFPISAGYFARVQNSSSSTGFLANNVVQNPGEYNAWVNYEYHALGVNMTLKAAGREPFVLVYPSDGIYIGDVCMAVRSDCSDEKRAAFARLGAYLTSTRGQYRVAALGRRPIRDGVKANGFPENSISAECPQPSMSVITAIPEQYAMVWRRPALTVYVVNYGELMKGEHLAQLRNAWTTLFGPGCCENLAQGQYDVTVVIPYATGVLSENIATLVGNAEKDREAFLGKLLAIQPGGASSAFAGIKAAYDKAAELNAKHKSNLPEQFRESGFNVSLILMTDDVATDTPAVLANGEFKYPVHTTGIGRAKGSELITIATRLGGRSVDANRGMTRALLDLSGMNK